MKKLLLIGLVVIVGLALLATTGSAFLRATSDGFVGIRAAASTPNPNTSYGSALAAETQEPAPAATQEVLAAQPAPTYWELKEVSNPSMTCQGGLTPHSAKTEFAGTVVDVVICAEPK